MQTSKSLEYHLLRVPVESLNKEFRCSQKSIEKDFLILEKAIKDNSSKKEDAGKFLEKIEGKIKGIKRKLTETSFEQDRILQTCQKRIEYLNGLKNENEIYNQETLDRCIIDYLCRSEFFESAKLYAKSKKIEHLVDIDVYLKVKPVLDDLHSHNTKLALQWCNENKSKLKKLEIDLEEDLHFQACVEMLRVGKRSEMVQYAKKNMKEFPQVRIVMACLIYKDPLTSPYAQYFNESKWDTICEDFKKAFYQLSNMPTDPNFLLLLQLGIICLKTPLSFEKSEFNVNDPLCDPRFQILSKDLPWSMHTHTKLLCRITGKIMDDHNPPMVLPNGNVYSLKGLESICFNGTITDPRSEEAYEFGECKKIFIM